MKTGLGGLLHGFTFGTGFELTRNIVVPAILIASPLLLWWWLGPRKPTCDAVRSQAARVAAVQIADSIRTARGDVRRAAVMHFANDSTDFITEAVRQRLRDNGTLDLDDAPFSERVRMILNLRNVGTFDVNTAMEYGRKQGLDAIVIGTVDRFETVKGVAEMAGHVKFVKVKTGEVLDIPLTDGRITGVPPPEVAEKMSLPLRILLTVVSIVVVPILIFPFLRLVMKRDSNLATAGILALLLVTDSLIISIALGTSCTFWGLAVFLFALAVAFGYDLFMLSYAQLCRQDA